MKKWQTITAIALTIFALSIGGFVTYTYLRPSHYGGGIFTDETSQYTTSTSDTISSTTETSQSIISTSETGSDDGYHEEAVTETETNTASSNIIYLTDVVGLGTDPSIFKDGGYYIVAPGGVRSGSEIVYSVYRLEREGTMADGKPIVATKDSILTGPYNITKEFLYWLRYYDPDNTPNSSLEENRNYFVTEREG